MVRAEDIQSFNCGDSEDCGERVDRKSLTNRVWQFPQQRHSWSFHQLKDLCHVVHRFQRDLVFAKENLLVDELLPVMFVLEGLPGKLMLLGQGQVHSPGRYGPL